MSEKSDARKRAWADPDIRRARIEGMREAAKRRYQDPEQREKARAQFAAQMADPEKARRFKEGKKKAIPKRNAAIRRHGLSESPEYKVWSQMIQRCKNPKDRYFHNYGGRGIGIASEWTGRGGFARFIEHIGRRPAPGLTVDRIDNDRGYEPGNVRWATRKDQSKNSRKVRFVTIGGETLHLSEWARRIGVTPPTLRYRISQGWTDDRLLRGPHGR